MSDETQPAANGLPAVTAPIALTPSALVAGPDEQAQLELPRGTRLDAWWAHLLSTPKRQQLWYWGGPLAMLLLAAVLRLWNLGSPHALIFDETYYVKDAYSLLRHGIEMNWAQGANPGFEAGDTSGLLGTPEFVVHPPLGKWMIALGIGVLGVENAFGWRITTALAGILAVWLVMMIARRLTGSTMLAVIAGLLMAVEGTAIVMSRVAILDNWVMLFALLGVSAVLADRSWHERQLNTRLERLRASGSEPSWGPAFWWRPWLIAAGLAFGASAAVKWSGLWFLLGFFVYVVGVDALARRRAGLPVWLSASILKQGPISGLLMAIPALLAYLASWTGWLLTSTGYGRNWAAENGTTGPLPNWLVSLWHWHEQALNYHTHLSTPHPYQANPLTWLFMIRPTSMYYEGSKLGEAGCWVDSCSSAITAIGNPLIWWGAVVAIGFLYWRLIRHREWQTGLILMGIAAGYLPWLMYLNRTMFEFYTIVFVPYSILAITWCIKLALGSASDPTDRRTLGIAWVAVYLGTVMLIAAYFLPLYTGMQIPFWLWNSHIWLPSWR